MNLPGGSLAATVNAAGSGMSRNRGRRPACGTGRRCTGCSARPGLPGDFTLEVRGPVTAGGREAIAVVATPRTGNEYVPRLTASALCDHLEVIVDGELGILLRYEEAFAGRRLSLTELTAVVPGPPEVADLSRFAPPAGSRISQDPEESLREKRSGPGWEVGKTVAGLAAGGPGAALRFASRCPGRPGLPGDDLRSAMPPAGPAVLETEGGPPPPDDLLYLLYRSGENPAFTATRDEWQDLSAMTAQLPDSMRAAGYGGVGYMIDSVAVVTREARGSHGFPPARGRPGQVPPRLPDPLGREPRQDDRLRRGASPGGVRGPDHGRAGLPAVARQRQRGRLVLAARMPAVRWRRGQLPRPSRIPAQRVLGRRRLAGGAAAVFPPPTRSLTPNSDACSG
jgi:hypothetical protein